MKIKMIEKMKTIFSILSLAMSIFAFGQNSYTSSPVPPPPSNYSPDVKADVTKIYDKPDKMPEFPGGVAAFESTIRENIDIAGFESQAGEKTCKSFIAFTVERDGSMTGIKVTGANEDFNREVNRAARGIRKKWNPGKYKGENVRSRVNLPFTMNFE